MIFTKDYLNRTLCDVLEDMRKCDLTKNYSPMLGLIEEAQIMGNKMEAGLNDKRDVKHYKDKLKKLQKEYKKLYAKKEALKEELKNE